VNFTNYNNINEVIAMPTATATTVIASAMGIVLEGYDSEYYKVTFKMTSNRTIEAEMIFSEAILQSSSSSTTAVE